MKKLIIPLLFFISLPSFAQSNKSPGGQLSIGVRSTMSLFSDAGGPGTGFGGQFRLRFYEFMNSEWFADYLTSGIDGIGTRTDYHIGWSVMFYFPHQHETQTNIARFKPYVPMPYFLAGHCFDYTDIRSNNPFYPAEESRWSSAIQAGLGMHIPLTPRMDFSTSAQYMLHLGTEITSETRTASNGDPFLHIAKEDHSGLEGHLLISFSLNYRIADLWKDKHGALGNAPHVQEDDQQ